MKRWIAKMLNWSHKELGETSYVESLDEVLPDNPFAHRVAKIVWWFRWLFPVEWLDE